MKTTFSNIGGLSFIGLEATEQTLPYRAAPPQHDITARGMKCVQLFISGDYILSFHWEDQK